MINVLAQSIILEFSMKSDIMKLLLTSLLIFGLASCGGGDSASTAAPTYNKIIDAGSGSEFDEVSQAWLHQHSDGCCNKNFRLINGGSNSPLNLYLDSELNSVVRFSTGDFFESDNFFSDLNWEVIDDSAPQPALNEFDHYAAWSEIHGTALDLVSSTEVGYKLEAYSFYPETGGIFLGTEYVSPMILFNDHGSDYAYGVGLNHDTLLQLEIIGSVYGNKTNFGDMPVSGSSDYSSRAIATAHISFWYSRSPIYHFLMSYDEKEIEHFMGVESDSTLTVDHDAGTISGSVTFDYVFNKGMYAGARYWHDSTMPETSLGTINFQGEISGRDVEGTARWFGRYSATPSGPVTGSFKGSFFGPNGDEFGGVITDSEYYEGLPGADFIVATIVAKKN